MPYEAQEGSLFGSFFGFVLGAVIGANWKRLKEAMNAFAQGLKKSSVK